MKVYGGVDVYIHVFLTSALTEGKRSASRSGRFTPGKEPPTGTHWIGGWVDPTAGLNDVVKILNPPGLENSDPSVVQHVANRYTD
jgi:hypothetical protein